MSAKPPQKAPAREALLAVHKFPGEYVIKAFGPGGEAFPAAATAIAHTTLSAERVHIQVRHTRSGGRLCVTLTMQVHTVEEVEQMYERLHTLDDLFLIL